MKFKSLVSIVLLLLIANEIGAQDAATKTDRSNEPIRIVGHVDQEHGRPTETPSVGVGFSILRRKQNDAE